MILIHKQDKQSWIGKSNEQKTRKKTRNQEKKRENDDNNMQVSGGEKWESHMIKVRHIHRCHQNFTPRERLITSTYAPPHRHACVRALTHTHTHTHTDTRTRIHTQTHAHTHPIVYTGRRGGKRSVRFSSIEMKKLAKINSHLYKETYLTTDFLTSRMSISHSTFRGTG